MTLRRYAHVLEDIREDAARAMDELFQGTSSSMRTTQFGGTPELRFRILVAGDAEER